jgi:hypothetical protein
MQQTGASRDALLQRLLSDGLPEQRAQWLLREAARTRRARWLAVVAKACLALFVVGFIAGFGLLMLQQRKAGAITLLAAAVLMTVGSVTAIVADTGRAIDWDPRGLAPRFYLSDPPRRARESVRSVRARWTLGVMFSLIAAAGITAGVIGLLPLVKLHVRGVQTSGTVVDRSTYSGKATSYYVKFRFEAERGVWIVNAQVPQDVYAAATAGQPTPVTYDPQDPETSRPIAKDDLTWSWIVRHDAGFIVMAVAFLVSIPFLLRSHSRRVEREVKLARNGVLVVGTVTDVMPAAIGYRFDADGSQASGQLRLRKRRLSFKPKPGDRIAIPYDRLQPGVNESVEGLVDAVEPDV